MNWNDVNKVLPDKDGDYLVFIRGAEIPCVLSYHSYCGVFLDENHVCDYNITHWMPLPENPKVIEESTKFPFPDLEYCIKFSFEEAIVHREHLQFILQYYCLPPFLEKSFEELLSKIKDVLGDNS